MSAFARRAPSFLNGTSREEKTRFSRRLNSRKIGVAYNGIRQLAPTRFVGEMRLDFSALRLRKKASL